MAAGSGARLGRDEPKAFVPLGGRPLLAHSLAAVGGCGCAEALVVVVVPGREAEAAALVLDVLPGWPQDALTVVPGGATRQESVWLGLVAVDADVVLCHDAARPFATPALFARVVAALRDDAEAAGVVPAVPAVDTVKRVRGGRIVETLPRAAIVLAQTPQGFRTAALRDAHERALREGLEATDDAMLLEAAGYAVTVVPGEDENFKVTTAEDLARAERVAAERAAEEAPS